MCGICGFSGPPDLPTLKSMNKSLFHRGPDESGQIILDGINLAMRRLSIVDIKNGKQPVHNENKTIWAIFNGEIYNHRKLRQLLLEHGHILYSNHSDTEIIVHLYEEYGENWVTHINGMFGIAIWDMPNNKLILYRDRIGKKPLYYSEVGGEIIFGSEIKAIRKHPLVNNNLDYDALYSYFGLKNISAPQTAYQDIKQLCPGEYLIWQNKTKRIIPYWHINMAQTLDITCEEASQELFQLLDDAVRIRMDCDAPYGAYLSGGIDSSAVVTIMNNYTSKIKTFCLGYNEPPEGQFLGKNNDIKYSRIISQQLQTDHHETILSPDEFAEGMVGVLKAFDEPFSGTCSTYFLTPLMQSKIKVALSGDGSDELFGSYLPHRLAFPLKRMTELRKKDWSNLTEYERDSIKPYDNPNGYAYLDKLSQMNPVELRDFLSVFPINERNKLLSNEFLTLAGFPQGDKTYTNIFSTATAKDELNLALECDQRELLPNQVLPFVDRLSMAFGVEVRCPFLDYRIIEFANKLPGSFKIHDGINKYIYKLAINNILPKELFDRPKEGFVQPNYSWIHGPLKNWTLSKLNELPKQWFQQDYLDKLIINFLNNDRNLNSKIWNLVCFSIWWNNHEFG